MFFFKNVLTNGYTHDIILDNRNEYYFMPDCDQVEQHNKIVTRIINAGIFMEVLK